MHLTFHQLAEMTGGEVVQGADVVTDSVVIDSREVKGDSVFFAITGDRLDGHRRPRPRSRPRVSLAVEPEYQYTPR